MNFELTRTITNCHNCGGEDIEWFCTHRGSNGTQDGRHKSNEIRTVFYLGCNDCSETIKILNESQGLTLLNSKYFGYS